MVMCNKTYFPSGYMVLVLAILLNAHSNFTVFMELFIILRNPTVKLWSLICNWREGSSEPTSVARLPRNQKSSLLRCVPQKLVENTSQGRLKVENSYKIPWTGREMPSAWPKQKKRLVKRLHFKKRRVRVLFGAEGGEQDTADLTGLWKTKISLSIWEPRALSAARASGRNPAVVSRWCVTDLTEFKINRVSSNVLKGNECDLQDCFVCKEFVKIWEESKATSNTCRGSFYYLSILKIIPRLINCTLWYTRFYSVDDDGFQQHLHHISKISVKSDFLCSE